MYDKDDEAMGCDLNTHIIFADLYVAADSITHDSPPLEECEEVQHLQPLQHWSL
jgi:hypothetical protein